MGTFLKLLMYKLHTMWPILLHVHKLCTKTSYFLRAVVKLIVHLFIRRFFKTGYALLGCIPWIAIKKPNTSSPFNTILITALSRGQFSGHCNNANEQKQLCWSFLSLHVHEKLCWPKTCIVSYNVNQRMHCWHHV